jgi:hypothetical protein
MLVFLLVRSLNISLQITVRLYALLWPSEHELNGDVFIGKSRKGSECRHFTTYVGALFLKFVGK